MRGDIVPAVGAAVVIGGAPLVRNSSRDMARRPTLDGPLKVGGAVFADTHLDGRLDEGERPLAGSPVTARNDLAGSVASATTDADDDSFVVDVGALPSVLISVLVELPAPDGSTSRVPVRLEPSARAGEVVDLPIRARERQCPDPATCPDLLLPDLVSLPATPGFLPEEVRSEYPGHRDWSIDRTTSPGRTLLRVATISANVGVGPLLVVGVDRRAGTLRRDAEHGHVHLDAFEELRLRNAEGVVASAHKLSFCLTDVPRTAGGPDGAPGGDRSVPGRLQYRPTGRRQRNGRLPRPRPPRSIHRHHRCYAGDIYPRDHHRPGRSVG